MDGKAQKSHGARSELNSVFGFEKVDRWNPIRTSAIQTRSRPLRFMGFSNHEKGAPRQEISKLSTVCSSTFSRSGWSVVRSASLAIGGTSKKRPSPHLHNVSTQRTKMSPRTLQTPSYILLRTSCLMFLTRLKVNVTNTFLIRRYKPALCDIPTRQPQPLVINYIPQHVM
jgi:hypothetical protein